MAKIGGKTPGQTGAAVTPLLEQAGRLLSAGKAAEALPILLTARQTARANPQAAHMLGVCLLQLSRLGEGVEALKAAAMMAPANPAILNHLGVALCQSGKPSDGASALKKASALAPNAGDIRNNLARALTDIGDFKGSAQQYDAAVRLAPHLADAWQGLASSRHKAGDIEAALDAARQAIARFPTHGAFHASLGRILIDLGRPGEAEKALRQALALSPHNGDAASNLGTIVEEQGRSSEALGLYELATKSRPDLADAWFNLGQIHEKQGRLPLARDALARCRVLRPDSAKTLSALIAVRRKLCDWDGIDDEVKRLEQLVMSPTPGRDVDDVASPFNLLSLMLDPSVQRRAAEAHGRQVASRAARHAATVGPFMPPAQRSYGRTRIGYLSPDFRQHPVAQLMAGVIEHHDRQRFEISCWSLGPDDASDWRARIIAGADRFEDLREASTTETVSRMRAAELDLVVDLAGYTAHARPEALALRVAPVQVNYLGYPGTMGAAFIDYAIVDPVVAPPGAEQEFSERLVRLPHCYQANDDRAPIHDGLVSRAEFGLPERGFVFACFSMNYKIDATVLDAWVKILDCVPGSVLWLFRTDPEASAAILAEATARGLDPARLVFADRLPKPQHLARHRLADLFLDTFAYGAHTTASDALWAGLPVLTLRGNSFARRVGASLVTAVGMPDMVTHSIADYVSRAIAIGLDPQAAPALRQRLDENRLTCALFSTAGIARDLEAAYLRMIDDAKRP